MSSSFIIILRLSPVSPSYLQLKVQGEAITLPQMKALFYSLCAGGTDDGFEENLAMMLGWCSLGRSSDFVDLTLGDATWSPYLGATFDAYMTKVNKSRPLPIIPTPSMLANPLLAFSFMRTTGHFECTVATKHAVATSGLCWSGGGGHLFLSFAGTHAHAADKPNAFLAKFQGRMVKVPSRDTSEESSILFPPHLMSVCFHRGGAITAFLHGVDPSHIAAMTGHAMKSVSNLFEYLPFDDAHAYQVGMGLMGGAGHSSSHFSEASQSNALQIYVYLMLSALLKAKV